MNKTAVLDHPPLNVPKHTAIDFVVTGVLLETGYLIMLDTTATI